MYVRSHAKTAVFIQQSSYEDSLLMHCAPGSFPVLMLFQSANLVSTSVLQMQTHTVNFL